MKAILKNFQQSPTKVRLMTKGLRGKRVPQALAMLQGVDRKSALPIYKLIKSASSQSKEKQVEELSIKSIVVDSGMILRRRGRARIKKSRFIPVVKKRHSTITVELE